MGRRLTAVLSTAAIAAVLGLPGCSKDEDDASPETAAPPTSASLSAAAAPQAAPLPAPDALAGVLYRLADAAVPGPQKLNLVEGATPESAAVFDQFANALINGGYAPVKFDVRDVNWSDRDPADVVANVDVSSTEFARSPIRVSDGIQAVPRWLAALGADRRRPAGVPDRHRRAADDAGSLTRRCGSAGSSSIYCSVTCARSSRSDRWFGR